MRGLVALVVLTTLAALVGVAPAGAASPLVNTGAPTVLGEPTWYETLTADPGTWDPDVEGTTFAYQWRRDGEPIVDATTPDHAVLPDDCSHDLSVEVTATAPGYDPGTAISGTVHIVCRIVEPSPTRVRLRLEDPVVRPSQRATLRIRVRAPVRATLTGELTVTVRRHGEHRVRLRAGDANRRTVRLPRLPVGRHVVKVYFDADDPSAHRDSDAAVLLRVRPRGGH